MAFGALMLTVVALLDNLTPTNANFGLFYLLAVLPVAWWAGQRAGIGMAVLATVVEGASGIVDQDPLPVELWNALTRLLVLSAIAVIADRLHRRQSDLDRVGEERRTLLRLLEREFPRPLRALDWFSRMLDESLEREALDAARKQIAPLRHHVREAAFLATDLLSIGSLHTGALRLERVSADLRAIVATAADATLDRARIVANTPEEPVMVWCDPDRLAHAIASMFARCVDTPYATVSVLVRVVATEGLVQLSTFHEVDGLDLELAQLLVVAMGGRIELTPRNAARGVVVRVFLPRSAVPPNATVAPAGAASSSG